MYGRAAGAATDPDAMRTGRHARPAAAIPPEPAVLLRLPQAAARMSISLSKLYLLLDDPRWRRRLRAVKIGETWRIPAAAIERLGGSGR